LFFFAFAQRARCAAAILLRPAAEITAGPVGNLALWLPRRDHGRMARTPLIAWHLGRGDVRGLGPLLSCTHCHGFPLHVLSDGTIQRGSCGDYIRTLGLMVAAKIQLRRERTASASRFSCAD